MGPRTLLARAETGPRVHARLDQRARRPLETRCALVGELPSHTRADTNASISHPCEMPVRRARRLSIRVGPTLRLGWARRPPSPITRPSIRPLRQIALLVARTTLKRATTLNESTLDQPPRTSYQQRITLYAPGARRPKTSQDVPRCPWMSFSFRRLDFCARRPSDPERLCDQLGILGPGRVMQVAHRGLDVGVAHPLLDPPDVR